ncbi:hypothetical protein GU926_14130 [Nibribacter ruber]|uniref:Uncharacterized protein n=1 Tax=Nibribacter ruber TaxID=2698458 RepID=A0A6P1P286_9BACT|nr:hypothetical protein [Nibribacter ruber]QHL88508.1 hypothetical protein GU926_14130 [Nibribacter ruber]
MRQLLLLLLFCPLWTYAGQNIIGPDTPRVAAKDQKTKKAPVKPSPQRFYNNVAAVDAFYQKNEFTLESNAEVRRATEFISNPFLLEPEPALQHYVALVKSRYNIIKDTIANLHDARSIDTLFHLNFDSSTVELYYPVYTQRFLLSYADVKSQNLALRNGIKVGMTRAELIQKLQGYKLYIKEQKNVLEVCDWERNSWLRFHLVKGRVASIQYEGYVD